MKTKLKTLKDIKIGNPAERGYRRELKAGAIKWVKDETEGYPDIYTNTDDLEAIRRWIKHFFNLTEEEISSEEGK